MYKNVIKPLHCTVTLKYMKKFLLERNHMLVNSVVKLLDIVIILKDLK